MKPYYADESVTLYLGDCREVVSTLHLDADLMEQLAVQQENRRIHHTRADDTAARHTNLGVNRHITIEGPPWASERRYPR